MASIVHDADGTHYNLHAKPHSFEELFFNGLKRHLGDVRIFGKGLTLNLGAGNSPIDADGVIELDRPKWHAPFLPKGEYGIDDESVGTIHAYHFFEHLYDHEVRTMLEECDRVMMDGAVLNICVPYARADLAFQDIDHKTFFTEETWKTLLRNPFYDTGLRRELSLFVHCNVIAGVKGSNLAIFTQLVKGE